MANNLINILQKKYIMITLFKNPIFQDFENAFETSRFIKTPETKVSKTDSEYKVQVSVPGLTKEDLKILVKEGILKISFEKSEDDVKDYFVHSFTKSYNIPDDVKERDIEGRVENGILELVLPIDKKKSIERLISLN
jgi:HSP20 family protein